MYHAWLLLKVRIIRMMGHFRQMTPGTLRVFFTAWNKRWTQQHDARWLWFILLFLPGGLWGQQNKAVDQAKWYVPDFAVTQFAGSIGLLSAGTGYAIFHDRAALTLLAGYVPASRAGGSSIETITLKFTAEPWEIVLDPRISIRPFSTGIFFCYTPGNEFSSDLPSWYPDGYYWWSEAVRVNVFIGGSVRMQTKRIKAVDRIAAYYELGTNELKLVSYVQNRGYMSLGKILHIGIGIRVYFSKPDQ